MLALRSSSGSYENIVALLLIFVDPPRIELGTHPCHGCILPLNYGPRLLFNIAKFLKKKKGFAE